MKPQLDKYFRPLNSPIANNTGRESGVDFDSNYEVQTKRIRASKSSIKNFVLETDTDSASVSGFDTGEELLVTFTLEPDNLFAGEKVLGFPIISVYTGTSVDEDNQIFPKAGDNTDPTDWIFDSWFDWGSARADGSNLKFMLAIENVSAGTVSLTIRAVWRYIANRAGEYATG